jgi:hypothetical protein
MDFHFDQSNVGHNLDPITITSQQLYKELANPHRKRWSRSKKATLFVIVTYTYMLLLAFMVRFELSGGSGDTPLPIATPLFSTGSATRVVTEDKKPTNQVILDKRNSGLDEKTSKWTKTKLMLQKMSNGDVLGASEIAEAKTLQEALARAREKLKKEAKAQPPKPKLSVLPPEKPTSTRVSTGLFIYDYNNYKS